MYTWCATPAPAFLFTAAASFICRLSPALLHALPWLCSKNAAYDFFPCQNQLFYRGKGKGGMW